MSNTRTSLSLRDLLDGAKPGSEKTASQAATPPSKEAVSASVKDALNSKTASENNANPLKDLIKVASDVIDNNRDGEIKHAQLLGRAMADGWAQRVEELNKAAELAEQEFSKVASENITPEDIRLIKEAKENPEAFLNHVYQGAMAKRAMEEKIAFEQEYNQTVAHIHQKTAEHYTYGYNVAQSLIKENAQ